ncbi:MAG: transporter substrate-binding domain-containing protein [Desulfobacterales bacterium]|nr:transporter substrate-binding domain-containing protein [Desulfobacterales bacterium]
MKKLVFFFLLATMIFSNAFANEVVKLAIGDWEPYTSQTDAKGKLLEKVVTEAFKLEGIDAQYDYFPWKRSYQYAEEGKHDGTFPWNKTEERDKVFYIHKISLFKDEGVFFHLKSKQFDWNTLEDLKKYKVGVTIGFKQEQIYKDNGITADAAPTEDLTFKKMLLGRIDIYQTSKVVGYVTINKIFSSEEAKLFTNHPKPVEVNEYYILFSRKTPNGQHFSEKLDSGLKKLKDSGAYDKILAEYIGSSM